MIPTRHSAGRENDKLPRVHVQAHLSQCGHPSPSSPQSPVHSNPLIPSTLAHLYPLAGVPSCLCRRSLSNSSTPSQGASSEHCSVATCPPVIVSVVFPQCRSEIKIQRPFNPLVQLCRKIDRQYSRLVLPGVVTTVFGTVLAGCWAHGVASLYLVFGRRDAQRIIRSFNMQSQQPTRRSPFAKLQSSNLTSISLAFAPAALDTSVSLSVRRALALLSRNDE